MKIALVAPPFIPVPPLRYGGTELFIAHLAEALVGLGHVPVVYTNGESRVRCERRSLFPRSEWPIQGDLHGSLKDLTHSGWACADAAQDCDVIHLSNAPGLAFSHSIPTPMVYTLHHPHAAGLSDYYRHYPTVHFVAISRAQARREKMPHLATIQHGLDLGLYEVGTGGRDYLCFVGRICPNKGTHLAIAAAKHAGIPLKLAGEIQPMYRAYWEQVVLPEVDGHFIEYVGEVDLAAKNALLGGARALLFPIEWEEPFGLIMIEAMACGTPVLAFPRGAAPEVVAPGVSGWLCRDVADMAARAREVAITPAACRAHVEQNFGLERMAASYVHIYRQAMRRAAPRPQPLAARSLLRAAV